MSWALFILGHYADYAQNRSSVVPVQNSTDNREFTVIYIYILLFLSLQTGGLPGHNIFPKSEN